MTAVARRVEIPAGRPPGRASPYQGLVPYTEADADYFFGRNAWREIVTDHLLAYRVSVLYGASGVGKTSVLRAGVVHTLRAAARRNLEVFGAPEVVPVIVSSWSGDPRVAVASGIEQSVAAVSPKLAREPPSGPLVKVLADWAARLGGPLAVVLDQFDEYFVYHDRDAATSAFAAELSEALLRGDVPVTFLVSIREDAIAKLDRFEERIPGLWENLLRIDHLDVEAAREAIEKPIARWNEREGEAIELERGLVEAVLAEADTESVGLDKAGRGVAPGVAEEPGTRLVEAPYLQLVMTRLWEEERRRGSPTLRVATLTRMGGGDQIVRRHFDSVMQALPRRHRKVAARIFRYLVTPAGTKIALPASALAKWSGQRERSVVPVLQTLADAKHRILRTVSIPGDHESATSYEIYHDRLAAGILDWGSRFARRRRRRRVVALVIAPALLLAVFSAGVAVDQRQSAEAAQREAVAAELETSELQEELEPGWSLLRDGAFLRDGAEIRAGVVVGGRVVAVGLAGGTRVPGRQAWAWYSDGGDGSQVAEVANGEGQQMLDVTAGGPGFVAVGSGQLHDGDAEDAVVWTSADGRSWERRVVYGADFGGPKGQFMWGVTAVGETLVAVGEDRRGDDADAAVWRSPDAGASWERMRDDDFGGSDNQVMQGVAASASVVVAVGHDNGTKNAAVWLSEDEGATWERVSVGALEEPGMQQMRAVAQTETGWIAVGWHAEGASDEQRKQSDGAVWTSHDGRAWRRVGASELKASGQQDMRAVAQSGEHILAVGFDGAGGRKSTSFWVSHVGDETWTSFAGRRGELYSLAADESRVLAFGWHRGGAGLWVKR